MSAIAGFWRFAGAADAAVACARMLEAQAMYGPHDAGQWDEGRLALGRRLFRLLPEDIHDRQPLAGRSGGRKLVADIRIDNRAEVESALGLAADQAALACDAAILLAAWEQWEEECFERLIGDYAFALWEGDRRRLVLARDPLGQRPLHFHRSADLIAFSSMPKGLHVLAEIPQRPDLEKMAEFLALMPETGSRSFFEGIERVEPGSWLCITPGRLERRRHWRPSRRKRPLLGGEDAAAGLRQVLDLAVASRLRGAGESVGAHLSAGWDSTAVTTSAALQMAPSGGRVVAFTAVPPEGYADPADAEPGAIIDEGPIAAATAALYGNIDHVLVQSTGRSPLAEMEGHFRLYDRPVLNLCNALWVGEINRQARDRGLLVLLTGDRGNCAFSADGLDWLGELAARRRWLKWARLAWALHRAGAARWRGLLARSFGHWTPGPLWNWLNWLNSRHRWRLTEYTLLSGRAAARFKLAAKARRAGFDFFHRPPIDALAAQLRYLRDLDLGNYYKGALAAWGVDLRDPTADRRVIEYCLSTPPEQLVVNGRPRALARGVLEARAPAEVLDARASGYQGADWHEALGRARAPLETEVGRIAADGAAASLLDTGRMRRLVENWPKAGWRTPAVTTAYRWSLLRAVSAGHFLRKASGSNQ